MFKSCILKLILFLLIGTLALELASCSSPQKYITVDASVLQKGMKKHEVKKLVGYPAAVTINKDGDEDWYYYNDNAHFWQKTPFLGKYLGTHEVETLMITFRNGKVLKWIYYVEKLSD